MDSSDTQSQAVELFAEPELKGEDHPFMAFLRDRTSMYSSEAQSIKLDLAADISTTYYKAKESQEVTN